MEQGSVTVPVKLTAKGFRDFAVFDTLVRQRRWVMPAVFCAILSASALVCHLLRDRSPNAGALVAVLLVVGVGLPVVYFISFLNSVRQQNRRMGLSAKGLAVYTVTLDGNGVHVQARDRHMDHPWESVYRMEQGKPAFAILTREPAQEIAFIHDRMPVILHREAMGDWLNPRYAAADVLRDAVVNVRYQAVGNRQESFLV